MKKLFFIGCICLSLSHVWFSVAIAQQEEHLNPPHKDPEQELMRLRTEGVAHYESGIAQKNALASFAAAIQQKGAVGLDYYNLAVILRKLNNNPEAKANLAIAMKKDPKLAQPHYLLGLILLAEANNPAALAEFQQAVKLAPNEPSGYYQISRIYREMGQEKPALQAIVDTLQLDPYHTGALYQLYLYQQQIGDEEKAQQIFQEFSRLKKAFGKTRLEINPDESVLAQPINGTVAELPFTPVASNYSLAKPKTLAKQTALQLVSADLNQDNYEDLVTASKTGEIAVYLAKADASFELLAKTAALGTLNDLQLAKLQRGGLYSIVMATDKGLIRVPLIDTTPKPAADASKAKQKPGTEPPQAITIKLGEAVTLSGQAMPMVLISDIDHDGDSDIIPAGFRDALINRGNASFDLQSDYLAAATQFDTASFTIVGGDFRTVVMVDYVAADKSGRKLIRDDMGGRYQIIADALKSGQNPYWQQIADMDNDGKPDIVSLTKTGLNIDYNTDNLTFASPQQSKADIDCVSDAAVIDFNNDGYKDIVYGTCQGQLALFANRDKRQFVQQKLAALEGDQLNSLILLDADQDGLQDIVAATANAIVYLKNTTDVKLANWLKLNLEGIRSAADGRYTSIEVRYGSYYSKYQASGRQLPIALGAAPHAELLRISWPNGFVENKLMIEPGKVWYFGESERISGSCPSVYAWNGEQYHYITDAFISGPMGVPIKPGQYFPVGADEYVKIPGQQLRPDADGIYRLAIVEELKEVTYLDQVKLIAVDYPATYKMFPNEYLMPPEFPEFKLHLTEHAQPPLLALDHKGNDVTEWVRELDYTYPHDFQRSIYTGFADVNSVEIHLTPEQALSDNLRLFLTGWFYYFDSTSLMAAAQQPDIELLWPQVQAWVDGEWQFISRIGIPSGKEKTVVVELAGKLPANVEKIRLLTNLEMYWDRILIDTEAAPAGKAAVVLTELPNQAAHLRLHGFSKLLRPASEFPMPDRFDYHDVHYQSLWNPLAGKYTRYGAVDTLTAAADSMLAVLGSGDEIALQFDGAKLPALRPGYQRDFLLYLNGFVKDGDKYTAHPGTVEPMPFQGMRAYPYAEADRSAAIKDMEAYQRYLDEYQTREPLNFN